MAAHMNVFNRLTRSSEPTRQMCSLEVSLCLELLLRLLAPLAFTVELHCALPPVRSRPFASHLAPTDLEAWSSLRRMSRSTRALMLSNQSQKYC